MKAPVAGASWDALATRLRKVGYSPDALTAKLGIRIPDDVGPLNLPAAVERLRADQSDLAAMIRVFFLESDQRRVTRIGTADLRHSLIGRGLLAQRKGGLQARLRLDAVGGQWFLSDRRFRSPDRRALGLPSGDPVYPPSADSLLLRDAVIPASHGSVLDLCTGSGVQALTVAPHVTHVTATDLSARAAAVTTVNAELNRVRNVTARVGDLYRPVRGQRFDTIIANPPFVSSPYRRGPAYHSGGPTGGRVLQRIVTGLPQALNPGGRFFAVSHLALRPGEDVATVVRPWFASFQGRALALVVERGSAIDLAAAQALFALEDGLAAYTTEVRRWVAYLSRHRIREVVAVLLVAEQGSKRAFTAIDALQRTLPLPLSHPPKHHIQQWLGG